MKKQKTNRFLNTLTIISSFVGIIGGTFGIYFGFKTLIDSDKSINTQLIQISKQTLLLSNQLKEIQKNNRLLIENQKVEKDKWIKQQKPFFEISNIKWFDEVNIENGLPKQFEISLLNRGGKANSVLIQVLESNSCKITSKVKDVSSQSKLSLILDLPKDKIVRLDFQLIFVDIDGRTYSQKIKSNSFLVDGMFSNNGRIIFDKMDIKIFKPIKR